MKLRKIVAVLTLVAMVCTMIPGVFAASSGSCGTGLTWSYSSGTLTISGSGAMDNFTASTIPWKSQLSSIKTVVVGDNVTTIGDSAFYNCTALTSVTMPDGITYIGSAAFSQCSALTTLTLPSALETIGAFALLSCSKLTSIAIPEGVETISSSAFYKCEALKSIYLPSTLKEVKGNAFHNCTALDNVYYTGSEADRAKLTISSGNTLLTSAKWTYSQVEHVCVYDQEVAAEKYLKSTATCTAFAVYYKSCTCGEFATTAETFNGTVKPEHNYVEVEAVAGTCQSTGTTAGVKCSICGDVQSGCEPTELGGHVPEVVPAVEATCTKPGLTEGSKCSLCGLTLTLQTDTPIAEHTSVEVAAVAATCSSTGLTKGAKCSVCQAILVAQTVTEKLPHTPETIAAVPSTCTETGLTAGSKCSKCGEILIAQTVAPLAPHVSEAIAAVAPTCAKDGLTAGSKCSVCSATLVEQEVDPATGNHGYVVTPAVAPTCTETGLEKGAKCPTCDEKIWIAQKVVPATGHTEKVLPAVAATCGEDGKTEGKQCIICEVITVEQKTVAATGRHSLVYTEAKEPTCTEEGVTRGRVCSVCDYVSKAPEAIAKLPHTPEVIPGKAATCLTTGLTEGSKCSVPECGEILVAQEVIPLSDHTPIFAEAKDATCEEDGYSSDTLICDVCGDILLLQGVVPAPGHTPDIKVEDGKVIEYCTVCGGTLDVTPGFFRVGDEYFTTLNDAAEAAEAGGTVEMLIDMEGPGLVIDKDLTIDFGGFTYSFTEGVGSTGTESNGLQILTGSNVTLKNGTLEVAEAAAELFYILVQNYADLTVTDMTLDGTNLDKWSATDGDSYTLSNNSGNVNIEGETNIIANDEGDLAFAFDVCKYASYEAPIVNLDTTGTIEGAIQVSEEISGNLNISGGTFTVPVEEIWCAEGFAPVANEDGTYSVVPAEEEIELIPADSFMARMVLKNDLRFQFGVPTNALENWDGITAVITKEYADGRDDKTVTVVVSECEIVAPYYAIEFTGVSAKEMCDTVSVQLFDAEDNAISEKKVDSIKDYAERTLRRSTNAESKTQLVDMLNYGAAAQVEFEYAQDALANRDLTDDEQALATQTVETENNLVSGTNYAGSRLVLKERIELQIGFRNIDNTCRAEYSYISHSSGEVKTVEVAGEDFIDLGSIVGVAITEPVVADCRNVVTVTVYDAEGEVVGYAEDSVESYASRMGGDLFEMIMKFSDSTYATQH